MYLDFLLASHTKDGWDTNSKMEAGSNGNWPPSELLEDKISQRGFPVSNLEIKEHAWERSHHARLIATGSSGKQHFFFIKKHDVSQSIGNKEIFVYQKVSGLMKSQITPPCRAAWRDDENGALFIIIDDVSPTHFCPGSPSPKINKDELVSVVEQYAILHASWWGNIDQWNNFFHKNACFTVSHEAISTETIAACEKYFCEDCYPQKIDQWGDGFSTEWREKTLAAISLWSERFTKRSEKKETLTLIHGDAHLGNVMISKKTKDSAPLLIDWEGICPGMGAWDIARLLHHTNLPEPVLADFESLVLRSYYDKLVSEGVSHFSYEDFIYDYCLSVLAYVPHSLAWGNLESMDVSIRALARWSALDLKLP